MEIHNKKYYFNEGLLSHLEEGLEKSGAYRLIESHRASGSYERALFAAEIAFSSGQLDLSKKIMYELVSRLKKLSLYERPNIFKDNNGRPLVAKKLIEAVERYDEAQKILEGIGDLEDRLDAVGVWY